MGDAAGAVVGHGAAELLFGHILVGDGLDDVGPSDKHAGGIAGHEHEVRNRGGIDGAAGAGSEDGADLGDDAAGQRIAQENFRVAGEGHHAFLDPRASGIVQAHDGRAHAHGVVHDLTDLHRVRLGKRAAKHGEVLGENEHQAAVHAPIACDEPVADDPLFRHAEIGAAVGDVLIQLFERALITEKLDALAGRELAFLVLALAAFRAAAGFGERVALLQFFEWLLCVHLKFPLLSARERKAAAGCPRRRIALAIF